MSILNSSTLPGVSIDCVERELRHRARMIPSVRFSAVPHSLTSTSLAVKSVSGADDDAYRVATIGPVTSRSSGRGSVEYTSTSARCSTAC